MALISTRRSGLWVLPLINAQVRRSFLRVFSLKIVEPHIFYNSDPIFYGFVRRASLETTAVISLSQNVHICLLARGELTHTGKTALSSVNVIFGGQNNSLSTSNWGKERKNNSPLIGNFVKESWWSRRTREERCFFSSKCFHSLNKFNKTRFDWQRGALPQCLLFALAFLVSSCAPFLNETKGRKCARTHTLYQSETSRTFTQIPLDFLIGHISSAVLCNRE